MKIPANKKPPLTGRLLPNNCNAVTSEIVPKSRILGNAHFLDRYTMPPASRPAPASLPANPTNGNTLAEAPANRLFTRFNFGGDDDPPHPAQLRPVGPFQFAGKPPGLHANSSRRRWPPPPPLQLNTRPHAPASLALGFAAAEGGIV